MSATATAVDRAHALLTERSAALARRGRENRQVGETRAYLVCACGGERLGLSLAEVAGVLAARPCTAVPGAPPALLGIVALSGGIVSVIDLAAALGLQGAEPKPSQGHLVRLRAQEPPIALAVERVLGIAQAEAVLSGAKTDGLGADAVSGYAPPGPDRTAGLDGDFSLVDLPRLLHRFLP